MTKKKSIRNLAHVDRRETSHVFNFLVRSAYATKHHGSCDAFIHAFICALKRHQHQRESAGSVVDNKNGRSRHLLLLMCTKRLHPEEPPPIRNICLFAQKKSFQQLPPSDFNSLCWPRLPWQGCFHGQRHRPPKWRNQLCIKVLSSDHPPQRLLRHVRTCCCQKCPPCLRVSPDTHL